MTVFSTFPYTNDPSPQAIARLAHPDPSRVEAYADSGDLLWVFESPAGSFPLGLTPENAHGLLDGTWRHDGQGNWFLAEAVSPGILAAGTTSPPCFEYESTPGQAFAPPSPGTVVVTFPPLLHDSGGDAWFTAYSTIGTPGVWMQRSDGQTNSWSTSSNISNAFVDLPDSAIATNDDITVIWRRISGGFYRLFATRYTTAGGWGATEEIHSSTGFIQAYDVLATADNDVIVAFHEEAPSGLDETRVLVFDHAAGVWGSALTVSSPGTDGIFCSLKASPNGEHVALAYMDWKELTGLYHHVWDDAANTFSPSTKVPVSEDVTFGTIGLPQSELSYCVDNDGTSSIIWQESLFTAYRLRANRFEGGAWNPIAEILVPLGFDNLDMTIIENTIVATPGGQVVGVGTIRPTSIGAYEVMGFNHRPGEGWTVTNLGPVVVELFTQFSRSKLVNYLGERVAAQTNDNSTYLGNHYNGAEWDTGFSLLPSWDLTNAISADNGRVLVVDKAGQAAFSRWSDGTTAFSSLGGGLGGLLGVPSLAAFCDQVVGQDVSFQLAGAQPNAPVAVVLGTTKANLPFFGGTLVPSPDFAIPATTDGVGTRELTLPWPPGVGPAFTFYYQAVVVDGTAPAGLALTNALAGTTP